MYNVLTAPGMLEAMDFAYYPCNHVGRYVREQQSINTTLM